MNLTQRRERLRALLAGDRFVHPALVFDPISARIAEDLGFEVGMMPGSIASAMVLGAPSLMVLTLTELADQTRRICRASSISLMVDADHGYGNALNVKRTVEELETAGAAAVRIEDIVLPQRFGRAKPAGEYSGEELVSLEEGVGKMKAALAGRQDASLVIMACTGALRSAGLAETIRRAKAYERAGVDALFLSGARSQEEVAAVHSAIRTPLLLGQASGELDESFLAANGVRMMLYPGHLPFLAAAKAFYDTSKALRDGQSPTAVLAQPPSRELLGQVIRRADYNRWIDEYLN